MRAIPCLAAAVLTLVAGVAAAGPLRDRIIERRIQHERNELLDDELTGLPSLPAGVRVVRDVAYGNDGEQRFDVYLPPQAKDAPVMFIVHGGGWARGDKAMRTVVENKVKRWVPKRLVVISVNYRMVPKAAPIEQARDVARALAVAQANAASWGGDPAKFILIGHSAGAHLVALLASSPSIATEMGVKKWLGMVLLDSAALDVPHIMQARHFQLYDRAFGRDPAYWKSASPYHVLTQPAAPVLAVCSTRRDDACAQAGRFVDKALSLGMRASVLEQNLSHREINQKLGEDRRYTEEVESFLRTLDGSLARMLIMSPRMKSSAVDFQR